MYAQSQRIGSQIYYNLSRARKTKIPKQDSQNLSKVKTSLLLQKEQDGCVM